MRVVLGSLAAVLLAALPACVSSAPGTVQTSAGNPIVTIGAGVSEVGGGNGWRVWYVIDTLTHTCWMKLGDSAGAMSCCDLLAVKEARPHLTWVSEASCQPAAR
jgi:hypothetical protein